MNTIAELIKQRQTLEAQIETARRAEVANAITQVKALIADHGLIAKDIFGATGRVAPKYRDPSSGAIWTGRGKAPKWIQGKDRTAFLI